MINIEYNDIKQILDRHGIKSLDEIEVGECAIQRRDGRRRAEFVGAGSGALSIRCRE